MLDVLRCVDVVLLGGLQGDVISGKEDKGGVK
jgi:hypothetical protein